MCQKATDIWADGEPCVLGIDEAGRGPVLGPMVYTAAYCPISSLPALNALGADDSKQLTEEQRTNLRTKIDDASFVREKTIVLSAQELSEKMLRKEKYNLNLISHDAALQLVEEVLDQGINVTEVYVDTVGNPEAYAAKFRNRFTQLKKVVVSKKADAIYRIVGAASIVAKTTRDRQVKDWQFQEVTRSKKYCPGDANMAVQFAGPLGSGYPGDPLTKEWMEANCDRLFGYPTFVRFSWRTTKTLLEKEAVQVEWESDQEEEDQAPDNTKATVRTSDIKSFFSTKPKGQMTEQPTKRRKITSCTAPTPAALRSLSITRVSTLL